MGATAALVGVYHLVSEKSSNAADKPHYNQPYECGFNQLGGTLFAGYTFLIWIFLLFELEIIMLLMPPMVIIVMPAWAAASSGTEAMTAASRVPNPRMMARTMSASQKQCCTAFGPLAASRVSDATGFQN